MDLDEARWDQNAATAATMELLLDYTGVVSEDLADNGWKVGKPIIDGAICRLTATRGEITVFFEIATGDRMLYMSAPFGKKWDHRIGKFYVGPPDGVGVLLTRLISLAPRVRVAFEEIGRTNRYLDFEGLDLDEFGRVDIVGAYALYVKPQGPWPGHPAGFEVIIYDDGSYNVEADNVVMSGDGVEDLPSDISKYFEKTRQRADESLSVLRDRLDGALRG